MRYKIILQIFVCELFADGGAELEATTVGEGDLNVGAAGFKGFSIGKSRTCRTSLGL